MRIKDLFLKYKEAILYLFFGGCTTLVNIISFYICDKFEISTSLSTVIAWIISVIFAFVTNKIFVFESRKSGFKDVLKETLQFIFFRAVTGIFDLAFMVITVDLFNANGLFMKILSNIFVIILNYIFSKLLIFRKS